MKTALYPSTKYLIILHYFIAYSKAKHLIKVVEILIHPSESNLLTITLVTIFTSPAGGGR